MIRYLGSEGSSSSFLRKAQIMTRRCSRLALASKPQIAETRAEWEIGFQDTKFGRCQRYIRSRFCGSMPDWIECDVADDEGLTRPDCRSVKASDRRTKSDAQLAFGQRPDHAIICACIKGCQLLI